jgi:hypothetical protein
MHGGGDQRDTGAMIMHVVLAACHRQGVAGSEKPPLEPDTHTSATGAEYYQVTWIETELFLHALVESN